MDGTKLTFVEKVTDTEPTTTTKSAGFGQVHCDELPILGCLANAELTGPSAAHS